LRLGQSPDGASEKEAASGAHQPYYGDIRRIFPQSPIAVFLLTF